MTASRELSQLTGIVVVNIDPANSATRVGRERALGARPRRGNPQAPRHLTLVPIEGADAEARAHAFRQLEQLEATAAPWLGNCIERILAVLRLRDEATA